MKKLKERRLQEQEKKEPFKHKRETCWLRIINPEHRFIYTREDKKIGILSCLYHD